MTSRRRLLAISSLGVVTLSTGCLDLLFGSENPSQTGDTDPTGVTYADIERELQTSRQERTESTREFEFGYGRESVETPESPLLDELTALSEASSGDMLRLSLDGRAETEFVSSLLSAWNVQIATTLDTTIGGNAVQFRGGKGPKYAYLATTLDTDILATRGTNLEAAKTRARNYRLNPGVTDPDEFNSHPPQSLISFLNWDLMNL